MFLLFHHWNNTTEDNEDTITSDTEGMSTLDKNIFEAYRRKLKYEESSSYDIRTVGMARVEKGIKFYNSMFDGDVAVI